MKELLSMICDADFREMLGRTGVLPKLPNADVTAAEAAAWCEAEGVVNA